MLAVHEVAVRFGGNVALRSVSLQLHTGEVTAVIGVNGAGKSVLLDTITGFQPAAGGSVLLRETPLLGRSPEQIRAMGVTRTFQQGGLMLSETVGTNLLLAQHLQWGRAGGLRCVVAVRSAVRARHRLREQGEELLSRFGLSDTWDVPVGELGAGQARCVEVSAAFLGNPDVALLDEPAAGLDAEEHEALAALISDAAARGIAVGLVEHNMSFVRSAASTVHVLHDGCVLATGTPETITTDPAVIKVYLGAH